MGVFSFFHKVGSLISDGLTLAKQRGLTDEVVQVALLYTRIAATKFAGNTERQAWVASILVGRGVPPNIASIAIELAVCLLRNELDTHHA